jgi:hypothetical protein
LAGLGRELACNRADAEPSLFSTILQAMKHTLRYCFVLLALATTGLFAEAATEPVTAPVTSHHKSVKVAKKGHHKKHKKHRKKGGK